MIQFACETCLRLKQPHELWVLALAAESLGNTQALREISVLPEWDPRQALHPLAVHFCSNACKNAYVSKLFGDEAQPRSAGRRPRSKPLRARKFATAPRPKRRKNARRAA